MSGKYSSVPVEAELTAEAKRALEESARGVTELVRERAGELAAARGGGAAPEVTSSDVERAERQLMTRGTRSEAAYVAVQLSRLMLHSLVLLIALGFARLLQVLLSWITSSLAYPSSLTKITEIMNTAILALIIGYILALLVIGLVLLWATIFRMILRRD